MGWPAIEIGDEFKARNNLPAAVAYYTQALKLGGEYWLAYSRRASAYYAMQRWEAALQDATRADERFPFNLESIKRLAKSNARLNRPVQATLAIADWVAFEPMDSDAYLLNSAEEVALQARGGKETPAEINATEKWHAEHLPLYLVDAVTPHPAETGNSTAPTAEALANGDKTRTAIPAGPFHELSHAALAAYDAGDFDAAQSDANDLLSQAIREKTDPYYGSGIFYAYLVDGLIALKRDHNVGLADNFLRAAGHTPGSATLNTLGPNMMLARDLLAQGDRFGVLDFLKLCRSFWTKGQNQMTEWEKTIASGNIPDFGRNLNYD